MATGARYLLEKRPNLLNCSLILPLVDSNVSNDVAKQIASTVGSSERAGPHPGTRKQSSLRVPSMSTCRGSAGETLIKIYAPYLHNGVASEYASVPIDCRIDIDRSVLSLHGDHLAARLAFTEYSAARDARDDWETRFPNTAELKPAVFDCNGIRCTSCKSLFVPPGKIKRVLRMPRLPWGELIECLTCVKPEDYLASENVDRAFRWADKRICPPQSALFVSESYICLNGEDASALNLRPYLGHESPLQLNESEENAKSRNWLVASCASCGKWIGDARKSEETMDVIEVRLFKFAIETEGIFSEYKIESVLCGATMDAATTRECHRFVLASSADGCSRLWMRLILLSYDSWISTNSFPQLRPVMKFLYWDCIGDPDKQNEAASWAKRTRAEWIVLPSAENAATIADTLKQSTSLFPHSMRHLPDGSSIGFVFW